MKKQTETNKEVDEENDDNIVDIMPSDITEGEILENSLGNITEQPIPDLE